MSTFGFDRLLRNRRGNVAMMYALVAPVLVFGGGAAIDYGRAAQIHTKLNAAADAAALAALTPSMLQQSTGVAQAAAVNVQRADRRHPRADRQRDAGDGHRHGRRHLAHAQRRSQLLVLGQHHLRSSARQPTLPLSGISQASAQAPPNIDFYVLLDNSPSMALPATAAGITQMQNLTTQDRDRRLRLRLPPGQHQREHRYGRQPLRRRDDADLERPPAVDSRRATPIATTRHGAQIDNYALARKNNITLRLDELNSGVSTLLQTASTTAQSTVFATPPKYRFSIYSMDSLWQIGLNQLMALTSNYTSGWTSASANFGVMEMYSNNNDCANSACSSSTSTPGGDVAHQLRQFARQAQPSRATSPIQATAPISPATRRRKCCSLSPTASRTNRAAAAVSSRRSTISLATPAALTATHREPIGARRSRIAASRSRSSIPTIWRCRQQLVPEPCRADPVRHRPRPAGLRIAWLVY